MYLYYQKVISNFLVSKFLYSGFKGILNFNRINILLRLSGKKYVYLGIIILNFLVNRFIHLVNYSIVKKYGKIFINYFGSINSKRSIYDFIYINFSLELYNYIDKDLKIQFFQVNPKSLVLNKLKLSNNLALGVILKELPFYYSLEKIITLSLEFKFNKSRFLELHTLFSLLNVKWLDE